ncbi:MAG: MaoC family dehydratase [Acidimicrobiaceae bacterium]|nr:MaoC family dehydratase [Acidimicrobiaceae bacterium]MXW75133.1 MaoC family dehydratase [Acidimicrobiaceae bacterium]MYA74142.1 MaoC family dehydratase [Acidimicrobiaceae bacterium]MYC42436.1 MaoC family dehydratase [Acidimicrobiaceae bacterium]MYD07656.1 MaoC family dehydratase [Acidimicrobiaceae bacterium]
MADDIDFDSFPVGSKGNQFEDFSEGRAFPHHWGRTITAGDNAIFSTATCNWNPMHLNAEYAKAHGHDDVVVNPMLVLCIAVGLSVEDLSESGGPFLGMNDVTFHRSVHPGDTLTASSTVTEARESASRPNTGVVTWHTKAHNQHGELVVDFCRTNLVAKRGNA